ncbi:putative vacuolar protein sorting-associate protein Vta1/Callose synthase [Rosa chinensis]|uniref:Putative vacuolar protein sorting-associate protein Vta1/Callose synthase n=1 Tax=Rosa chinensis TaxID=74649 RepID=A0A2P6PI74_ROSCH|nr:protein HOMOLOG OF MAMMALIAN LYST-INTERACTING PROTEIN 5 [Rosa chinensis]PRQ21635.1 putative vacuolar protein sorting-associate protein Vta1/Callose synthase [Rosa chinensis]
MASDNEPAKLLLPYLQRADELQKHEPLVAYYCRLYAMERGLKIPQNERTKTTNSLLISLMKQLEKDKKSLQLGPEDNLYLEGFALNVFGKADKQDRAGRADLNTAKTFYAASIFFEIINQFGVLQPDLEQKQKYAAWKAADIRKAVKEGRKPQAGPPAGDDDLSVPSSTTSGSYDLGPSETAATSPGPQSDPSSQFFDEVNKQHPTNIAPSQFHDKVNFQRSASFQSSPQFHDRVNDQHSANIPPPSQSYPSSGYPSHDALPPPPSHDIHRPPPSHDVHPPPPSHDLHLPPPPSHDIHLPPPPSHDIHLPPPTNRPNTSDYPQPYHQQPYPHEPQQPLPHDYPPHDITNYTYPNLSNFQSYPSFTESSIPAVSSQYPSYYQGIDPSYTPQSAPSTTNYPSAAQHQASHRNGTVSEPAPPAPSKTYQYDSSYMPSPEKIAEAHKAARFAVGALAFDDVSVAVDHLIKSLELLTNPSAGVGK